jgi:transposase
VAHRLVDSRRHTAIIVGLEPTGIYHEAWAYALQRDFGDTVVLQLVNPFRTKQKCKQLNKRAERKTDPIDAESLAHCLRDDKRRRFTRRLREIARICSSIIRRCAGVREHADRLLRLVQAEEGDNVSDEQSARCNADIGVA